MRRTENGLTRRPLDQDRPKVLSRRTRSLVCDDKTRSCAVELLGDRHRYEVRLDWETVEQLAAMIAAFQEQQETDDVEEDDGGDEERQGMLPGLAGYFGDADPKDEDQIDVREEEISQLRTLAEEEERNKLAAAWAHDLGGLEGQAMTSEQIEALDRQLGIGGSSVEQLRELADQLREGGRPPIAEAALDEDELDEGDEEQALGETLAEDFIAGLREDRETIRGPLEAVAENEVGNVFPLEDEEPRELTEEELERQRRRDEAIERPETGEDRELLDQFSAAAEETLPKKRRRRAKKSEAQAPQEQADPLAQTKTTKLPDLTDDEADAIGFGHEEGSS